MVRVGATRIAVLLPPSIIRERYVFANNEKVDNSVKEDKARRHVIPRGHAHNTLRQKSIQATGFGLHTD